VGNRTEAFGIFLDKHSFHCKIYDKNGNSEYIWNRYGVNDYAVKLMGGVGGWMKPETIYKIEGDAEEWLLNV